MSAENYTDEQLYQGVGIRPGVFRTMMRPFPPPRVLTGLSEGIHPSPGHLKLNARQRLEADWTKMQDDFWGKLLDNLITTGTAVAKVTVEDSFPFFQPITEDIYRG